MSANIIATCFALIAFAASVVVGVAAGNTTMTILYRSLVAMIVCLFVGKIVGHVGQRSIEASIEEYKQTHPIPRDPLAAIPPPEGSASTGSESHATHKRSAA